MKLALRVASVVLGLGVVVIGLQGCKQAIDESNLIEDIEHVMSRASPIDRLHLLDIEVLQIVEEKLDLGEPLNAIEAVWLREAQMTMDMLRAEDDVSAQLILCNEPLLIFEQECRSLTNVAAYEAMEAVNLNRKDKGLELASFSEVYELAVEHGGELHSSGMLVFKSPQAYQKFRTSFNVWRMLGAAS